MVVFYLRNSRLPDGKIVPVTIALNQEALQEYNTTVRPSQNPLGIGTGFPNLADLEGDSTWLISLSTTERDINGNPIVPEFINVVTTGTVHLELEAALGRIGQQVDWGTPLPDTQAPQLVEIFPPLTQTSNVSIGSNISIRLRDPLPAAGIDLSTVRVRINGIEVTGDVEFRGNVFDLTLVYNPVRIYS